MRWRWAAAWWLLGCSGPPPRPPPEPVAPPPAVSASAPSASAAVSPRPDPYVARLAAHLEPALGVRAPEATWRMDQAPLHFDVAAYDVPDGRHLVTRGLGRVRQAWAVGSLPPRVELAALVDRPRPEVLAALRHLGRWLHGETEDESASRFGPFQVLRTDRVLRSVRYFVLVPAQIFGDRLRPAVDEDEITFLEVMPIGPEEYAQARMRGEGFVIAWWQKNRDPVSRRRRWARLVEGEG